MSSACSHAVVQFDDESIKKRFGARLRSLRQARGLSQEDLALSCQLDRTYIGGVERGERNISLINIIRLACSLNVHASAFFTDDDHE